jgi:hypothetical protein
MILKGNGYTKYAFYMMQLGDKIRIEKEDVRRAQKIAHYYRIRCKKPINVVISKDADGHYCERLT